MATRRTQVGKELISMLRRRAVTALDAEPPTQDIQILGTTGCVQGASARFNLDDPWERGVGELLGVKCLCVDKLAAFPLLTVECLLTFLVLVLPSVLFVFAWIVFDLLVHL